MRYVGTVLMLLALIVGPDGTSQEQRVIACLNRGGYAVTTTYQRIIRYTIMRCVDQDGNAV